MFVTVLLFLLKGAAILFLLALCLLLLKGILEIVTDFCY